jgi:hypothetical protein
MLARNDLTLKRKREITGDLTISDTYAVEGTEGIQLTVE